MTLCINVTLNETKTNYRLTAISRMTSSKMTFCLAFTNSFYITAISKMTLHKKLTLSIMRLRQMRLSIATISKMMFSKHSIARTNLTLSIKTFNVTPSAK